MNKSNQHEEPMASERDENAEFDLIADAYEEQHAANIAVSGESPDYFSAYKIIDLAQITRKQSLAHRHIFDFGSGIGNSIPFFKQYFPASALICGDVSKRSLEIAKARFPDAAQFVRIFDSIPLPSCSQDVVFSACVFHHIAPADHAYWLSELYRILHPDGLLVIYEHNPLNPLTVHAVNTCPFDVNAQLIPARVLKKRALSAGFISPKVDYRIFFPAFLKSLRPLENYLQGFALGAQYRLSARRPSC